MVWFIEEILVKCTNTDLTNIYISVRKYTSEKRKKVYK